MVVRPPRIELARGVFHVVERGNERALVFRDDQDRERFLEILGEVAGRYRWRVLGYCLMGNHFHLLVMTLEPTLARGLRQLNGVYAQWFNRRHRRVGHLFQGRYKAVSVQTDAHLRRAVRYVIRNPIPAGLSSKPEQWQWTSHHATVYRAAAGVVAVEAVLACFADDRPEALRRYRRIPSSRARWCGRHDRRSTTSSGRPANTRGSWPRTSSTATTCARSPPPRCSVTTVHRRARASRDGRWSSSALAAGGTKKT